MLHRLIPSFRFAAASLALLGTLAPVKAQQLREQPIPYSVWLDFEALSRPDPPRVSLPIWFESLQVLHAAGNSAATEQTSYRMRLRKVGSLNREIQLRVFFDDAPDASPSVSAWTETGARLYGSDPLGAGLDLPSSVSLLIPAEKADYIDVTVPGNGSNIRGVLLSSVVKTETRAAVDFPPTSQPLDPFGNLPATVPDENDLSLYGRVRAMLDAKPVRLSPVDTLSFDLQQQPLVAVVTFEVLNADIAFPPDVTVNDHMAGATQLHLPDLADPGYRGEVRPMEKDMHFRYTGWLHCEVVIPGSLLKAGPNELALTANPQGGSVAVRSVELQLKHNWQSLDYTVTP